MVCRVSLDKAGTQRTKHSKQLTALISHRNRHIWNEIGGPLNMTQIPFGAFSFISRLKYNRIYFTFDSKYYTCHIRKIAQIQSGKRGHTNSLEPANLICVVGFCIAHIHTQSTRTPLEHWNIGMEMETEMLTENETNLHFHRPQRGMSSRKSTFVCFFLL